MSNYAIKLIEKSEYSADDYYKIINLCNEKIINIDKNIKKKDFLNNLKNIIIINKELKYFFEIIFDSLDFFIDNVNYYNNIKSIVISFEYKDNTIEYCLYEDDLESVFLEEKINIINKNGHSFETYTQNYEEKLIKVLDLKSVSIKEFSDFLKELFASVPVKIL
jgi:hypothetical protein